MNESFDSEEEGVLIPKETPKQLQAKIILAFQNVKDKPPFEISLVLHEHLNTLKTFSGSTLKEIITLSKNIYFAFSQPEVFERFPKALKQVIAEIAFKWLAKNRLIDSREEIPSDVVFFAGWIVEDPSKIAEELMIKRISEDLLDPSVQRNVRVDRWARLDLLKPELIKRCLELKNREFKCLLGEVIDYDFSAYPAINKAMGELKTQSFDAVIEDKKLKEFGKLLKGLNKPHHLETLQILIRRLIVLVETTSSKDIYEDFLEKCFKRLMHFSEPKKGLKLERELLLRYLAIIDQYLLPGNLEKLLMTTLTSPDGATLLSYIRRSVGNFEEFLHLKELVSDWSILSVIDKSDEYLLKAVKKGFFDVQRYLRRTLDAGEGHFYEGSARVVVEKCDADLDVAQDGLSFFSLALFRAGKKGANHAGIKALDFYIRQKIKLQGDATKVLSRVIAVFASNNGDAHYYHRLMAGQRLGEFTATVRSVCDHFYYDYYQGCVLAVKGLVKGYGAKPTQEMVEKISAANIPEEAKQAIIQQLQSAMVFNPFEISDALKELSKRLAEPGHIEDLDKLIKTVDKAVNYLTPAEKKSLCKRKMLAASREFLCTVGVGFKELFERDVAVSVMVQRDAQVIRHATAASSVVSVEDSFNNVEWGPWGGK